MGTPTNRTPVRIARGSTTALNTGLSDIQEGEIVWDTTLNKLQVKEGSALEDHTVAADATKANLAGADFTGPINVGVDDTGHDVKFFGASAGKYFLWDESGDKVIIEGGCEFGANDTGTFKGQASFEGQVNFIQTSGDQHITTSSNSDLVFGQTVGNGVWSPHLKLNYGKFEAYWQGAKKLETTTDGVTVTGDISLPSGNISAPAETSTHTLGGTLEVGGPNGNDVGKIKIRTRTANWHGYADATSPATGYSTYGSYFHTGGETLSVNIDTGDYFVIRSSANGTNAKQGTDEIMRFSSGLAEVRGVATGGVYDATSDAASAGASWAIDFADGNNQKVTLAAANLLSVLPTNQTVGQSGSIFITQPGTPLSLGWHGDWKWAGGTAPSLTQTGGATDRLDYVILAANTIHAVLTKAVA